MNVADGVHWVRDLHVGEGWIASALLADLRSGSSFIFLDHIHGPCFLQLKPGQQEAQYDEWKIYREHWPDEDWDAIQAGREKERAEINQYREAA